MEQIFKFAEGMMDQGPWTIDHRRWTMEWLRFSCNNGTEKTYAIFVANAFLKLIQGNGNNRCATIATRTIKRKNETVVA
jgi:hypothetical protein